VTDSLWDVAHISDYADKGESLAVETMKISGYYLGLAIVSVANLLDIQNFILGGGIANSSEIFYQSAFETATKRTLPQMSDKITIRKAKFVEKSGIIGSAIFGMKAY
jgi:glucokinase